MRKAGHPELAAQSRVIFLEDTCWGTGCGIIYTGSSLVAEQSVVAYREPDHGIMPAYRTISGEVYRGLLYGLLRGDTRTLLAHRALPGYRQNSSFHFLFHYPDITLCATLYPKPQNPLGQMKESPKP